jgi:hypothetical protein
MADEKDDEEKGSCFTTRITSFPERSRESESGRPRTPKLPPVPGSIPEGGEVDPDQVLNRKK